MARAFLSLHADAAPESASTARLADSFAPSLAAGEHTPVGVETESRACAPEYQACYWLLKVWTHRSFSALSTPNSSSVGLADGSS